MTSYERDIKLTGILYLHRITDVRMSGTTFRNLRMFGKLCGDNPASKVIFVTTMWDKTSTRPVGQAKQEEQKEKELQQREKREQELMHKYWRPMLELGARTDRFLQDQENCAQGIIKRLLDPTASEAIPTLLQEETVDQRRAIVETAAAKALYTQMQTLLSQHKAAIADLQEAAKRTNNPEMSAELEKERARIQSELDKTFADARKLKLSLLRRIQLFFTRSAKGVCNQRLRWITDAIVFLYSIRSILRLAVLQLVNGCAVVGNMSFFLLCSVEICFSSELPVSIAIASKDLDHLALFAFLTIDPYTTWESEKAASLHCKKYVLKFSAMVLVTSCSWVRADLRVRCDH